MAMRALAGARPCQTWPRRGRISNGGGWAPARRRTRPPPSPRAPAARRPAPAPCGAPVRHLSGPARALHLAQALLELLQGLGGPRRAAPPRAAPPCPCARPGSAAGARPPACGRPPDPARVQRSIVGNERSTSPGAISPSAQPTMPAGRAAPCWSESSRRRSSVSRGASMLRPSREPPHAARALAGPEDSQRRPHLQHALAEAPEVLVDPAQLERQLARVLAQIALHAPSVPRAPRSRTSSPSFSASSGKRLRTSRSKVRSASASRLGRLQLWQQRGEQLSQPAAQVLDARVDEDQLRLRHRLPHRVRQERGRRRGPGEGQLVSSPISAASSPSGARTEKLLR